jgi:flagellar protein FlaJ
MILALSGVVTALTLVVNFLYFIEIPNLFSTINIVAIFIFAFPVISIKYMDYRKKKQVEDMFPVFLRDFVESIRGGMTVPTAFKNISVNDYGPLTYYVKKMSAQMDWGIPIEKVLLKFSKEVQSVLIGRIVSSVIESHRFGGNLADTFEALSNTALEVERLRSERSLYMHSQMITGYIIFFVFLGVIIGLGRFLIPSLTGVSASSLTGGTAPQQDLGLEYKSVFRNLILIQGFFAGLAVGKMAEGAIVAGLKHSFFMMFVGILMFTIAG